MAKLKVVAVITNSQDLFDSMTQFSHKEGVCEYHLIRDSEHLSSLEGLSSVIFVSDSKSLEDFESIKEVAIEKGVSIRWQ